MVRYNEFLGVSCDDDLLATSIVHLETRYNGRFGASRFVGYIGVLAISKHISQDSPFWYTQIRWLFREFGYRGIRYIECQCTTVPYNGRQVWRLFNPRAPQ